MTDYVETATRIAGLLFVTTSMAAAGLAITPGEVLGQLRRGRLVVVALTANFLVAPLIAWTLGRVIPIDPAYAAGLLLIGGAAGAPILPKLAEVAGGTRAHALTLLLLLLSGTLIFLPLAMPLIVPASRADAAQIGRSLLLFILVPLAGGMLLRSLREPIARRLAPRLSRLSDIALITFIVLVLATHVPALRGVLGSGAILAALLFVLAAGASAYSLGGPDPAERRVLAVATAQRNIAAALVTAGSSFADEPKVMVMVLVTDTVGLLVLFTAASILWRRARVHTHAPPGPGHT